MLVGAWPLDAAAHVVVQPYVAGDATWLKLGTARDGRGSHVDLVSPSKLEARKPQKA